MRVGTLVILKNAHDILPSNCIQCLGQWFHKNEYPELYEIFKGCKCTNPPYNPYKESAIDLDLKNMFHLPDGKGMALIVYREN